MVVKRRCFARTRRAAGYTQEGLAEYLGVDRTTVARWEAGEYEPQPWLRSKIARALQVSIERLDELLAESGVSESEVAERLGFTLQYPLSVDLVTVAGRC